MIHPHTAAARRARDHLAPKILTLKLPVGPASPSPFPTAPRSDPMPAVGVIPATQQRSERPQQRPPQTPTPRSPSGAHP